MCEEARNAERGSTDKPPPRPSSFAYRTLTILMTIFAASLMEVGSYSPHHSRRIGPPPPTTSLLAQLAIWASQDAVRNVLGSSFLLTGIGLCVLCGWCPLGRLVWLPALIAVMYLLTGVVAHAILMRHFPGMQFRIGSTWISTAHGPDWAAFAAAGLAVLVVTLSLAADNHWRWRRHATPGICSKCQYDLRYQPTGLCPECGATNPTSSPNRSNQTFSPPRAP